MIYLFLADVCTVCVCGGWGATKSKVVDSF